MDEEEQRIARLLDSVEKEEEYENIPRPTGTFVRDLFPNVIVDNTAVDSSDESEPELELPNEQLTLENERNAGEQIDSISDQVPIIEDNDFDDLECIPLKDRLFADIVVRQNGNLAYMSKNKKMLWNLNPQKKEGKTASKNILRMRVGCVTGSAKEANIPVEAWDLFFGDDTIHFITSFTNIYINSKKEKFSRQRDSKVTNENEIKAVLGILYMAGVMHSSHHNLEDLWATDGTGVEFFRNVMSLSRFKFLLRCIRFDDITTREDRKLIDKLAPIRDLFDDFVEKCKKHYNVSEFVTVDEMLESFRGRCSFRQYMRNKPAKYGIKIYAMACAKTFYTSNMEVYVGAQPAGPYVVDNSGKEIVLRMTEPISGSGRNVTVDNFFTSIPLCQELLRDHRLTLVGTLRKNKGEIPRSFIDTKDRPVGGSCFAFRKDCTLVSFKAKKNKDVILLSSMHDSDNVDMNADSHTFEKPDMILFYNSSKGGVDTVDKYKQSYTTARITNRWSMRVFYTLLDIGALNSYIILKKNLKQPITRRKFIQDLAFSLCKGYGIQRLSYRNIPKPMKRRMCEILSIPEQQNLRRDPPPDGITSGRCYLCSYKKNRPSKTRCLDCKLFICREHSAVKCSTCNNGGEGDEMQVESDST